MPITTPSSHPLRLAQAVTSILAALALLAACSGNSTDAYLTNKRAGLIVNEGFTTTEALAIPDEYILAIGQDICDDLTNGRKPGSYERYVIENAAKHLC